MADSDIASGKTKMATELVITFVDLTKNAYCLFNKRFVHKFLFDYHILFEQVFLMPIENFKRDPFHM